MLSQDEYRAQHRVIEIDFLPAPFPVSRDFGAPTHLLGVVQYCLGDPEPLPIESPSVSIALRHTDQQQLAEVWISPSPVVITTHGLFRCARNDEVLFGACQLQESGPPSLRGSVCDVYTQLTRLTKDEGYPYLLRVWNYLDRINDRQDGLERYRHFCVGRHAALSALGCDLERGLPAASGIGTRQHGLTVYFLAAREPGESIENPRQVSAYHYPVKYSPRTPLFARAMLKEWGGTSYLFISGTASIVRHETMHVGDVRAQLAEAFRNIDALLDQAAGVARMDFRKSEHALFKVYLRRADDFPAIQEEVRQRLGMSVPVIYLEADLCRRELLVEIEGMYRHDG